MLGEEFQPIRDVVYGMTEKTGHHGRNSLVTVQYPPQATEICGTTKVGHWVAAANITGRCDHRALTVEDEVRDCFQQLQGVVTVGLLVPVFDNKNSISGIVRTDLVQLCQRQYIPLFHGPLRTCQLSLCDLLRQ